MQLLSFNEHINLSENLSYHIDNNLTLTESIFRIGSDAYLDLINEARRLHAEGKIALNEHDTFIVEKLQTGKQGTYTDRKTGKKTKVKLDDPHIRAKNEPTKNLSSFLNTDKGNIFKIDIVEPDQKQQSNITIIQKGYSKL